MSHAMIIDNHQSPFIGPIKIYQNNVTNYPPWTMVVEKLNVLISIVLARKNRVNVMSHAMVISINTSTIS